MVFDRHRLRLAPSQGMVAVTERSLAQMTMMLLAERAITYTAPGPGIGGRAFRPSIQVTFGLLARIWQAGNAPDNQATAKQTLDLGAGQFGAAADLAQVGRGT